MNYNAIPCIIKGTYIRKENEHGILIARGKDINYAIKVNSIGMNIINLCNSKNTIYDIVKKLQIIYNDNDYNKILEDVIKFIRFMKKEEIINCNMEDYMFKGKTIFENDNYSIYRCGEDDIKTIIESIKGNNIILGSEMHINSMLNKIYIRNQLFNFSEEYYILNQKTLKSNVILGLKEMSNSYIKIYTISLLSEFDNFNYSYVKEFISKSIENIKNDICKECLKIKVNFPSVKNKKILELLEDLGFVCVGKFKNEFGNNIDCLNYELML